MVQDWYNDAIRWGTAEGLEIQREESRGLRKKPISLDWNVLMEELKVTVIHAF